MWCCGQGQCLWAWRRPRVLCPLGGRLPQLLRGEAQGRRGTARPAAGRHDLCAGRALCRQAEFYAKLNLCPPSSRSRKRASGRASAASMAGSFLAPSMSIPASTGWAFSMAEFSALLEDRFTLEGLNVSLLMSHLACADDPPHPLNRRQGEAFAAVRAALPAFRRVLPIRAASSWAGFTHDLVRPPRIALYGGNPTPGLPIRCRQWRTSKAR